MDTGLLMMIVGITCAAGIVNYFFLRWVFSMNEQLNNQRHQIELLQKIVEKLDK